MNKKDEVIINVEHLTKDYGYGRGVFDISVKIHKGECYGYLGPNGAGKSTTIRHIMGFAKPTVGKVQIFGIDSFGNTDKLLAKVGYLPGEPAIPQGLDGWGFIEMMQGMRGEANKERLQYLLDLFKFDPGMPVKQMSLGEKRKLAVVAAFMNDPDVLVLDEPTSGLDPVMQKVFIKFILDEKKRGKTILLSSHIFSEVDATCDTISIIKDGKHVSTFNANELKKKQDRTYIIHFLNKEDLKDYIENRNKFEVVYSNEELLIAVIKFPQDKHNEFFLTLEGMRIKEFEEKPFTLQDYFMSFYKEERSFDGLSGVKGNSKEGLNKEKNNGK